MRGGKTPESARDGNAWSAPGWAEQSIVNLPELIELLKATSFYVLDELEALAAAAPPMIGAEYLTASVLEALWIETTTAFRSELDESKASVEAFLQRRNAAWHLVGRVHFNLAENRRDDEAPFAFLATYTTRLSAEAKAQHLPLGRALSEYAGAANKPQLLSLLLAGPARRFRMSVAEDDGRGGRDLSPVAVDARGGLSAAD